MNIAGHQLEGINAKIDLQKVKAKTVSYSNMTNVDLSNTSFNDVCVKYANLTGTNAIINVHDLYQSSIEGTNLDGCYVILDLNRINEIKVNDETKLDGAVFLDANMVFGEDKYYQTIAPEVAKTLVKSIEKN